MKQSAPRKVISLIRVSSEGQAKEDRTGIARQLEDIEIHCKNHNLKVVEQYQFEGLSGANVEHSRKFREMLSKLKQPSIAGIVFSTVDRFFRPESLSSFHVFKPFEETGKLIFCNLGALDLNNDNDQSTIMMYGKFAGMDRKRIKDMMVRGKEKNRSRADTKSDPLPVGVLYDKESRTFHYTKEAERIKTAMYKVLKGDQTLRAISDELGFKNQTCMRQALKRVWWIGQKASKQVRVERTLNEDGRLNDGRKVNRKVPIIVETNLAATPLVPVKVFNQVQEILGQKHTTWTKRRSLSNNILGAGLMHCQCGRKMYAKSDKRPGKPDYYICSSYYLKDKTQQCGSPWLDVKKADAEIWWSIMTYLTDEQFLAVKAKEAIAATEGDTRNRDLKVLEKEISTIERKKTNLMKVIEDLEEDDAATYGKRIKALNEDQAAVRVRLATLRSQDALMGSDPVAVANQLKQRFFGFDKWDRTQQKAILAECVKTISLDGRGNADFEVRVGLPLPSWKPEREGMHPKQNKAFRNYMMAQTQDANKCDRTGTGSWPRSA
jgi:DNA invertase Pin-like site-specific DNA recombinase